MKNKAIIRRNKIASDKKMADWVHCNKCFARYQPGIKFFITTCGHIQCHGCVRKLGDGKQCHVCNSPSDKVTLNNLSADLQCFFRPQSDFIAKAKQICEFQQANMQSLLKNITSKYTSAKAEILKNYKTITDLKKENHKLRMLLNSVARGGGFTTSTPMISAPPMRSPSSAVGSVTSSIGAYPVRGAPNSSSSFAQKQGLKFMQSNQPGSISRMRMPRQPLDGINSFASHSGISRGESSQDPSPAQASIPRFGTPSYQHAAMRSMANLGLGNKPR